MIPADSHLNWSSEKPTFEEVKDKIICLVRENKTPVCLRIPNETGFYAWIDSSFIRYAIISTEEKYCEWEKILSTGMTKEPHHNTLFGTYNKIEYCPFCGLPIKAVEQEKPLLFAGKAPDLCLHDRGWYYVWSNGDGSFIHSKYLQSEQDAIAAWNKFVKKLEKE
jgi:hypothetical protein